jgi:hypothetical protein
MAKDADLNGASSNNGSSPSPGRVTANAVVDINELIERNGPYADTLRELVAEGFTGAEYLAELEAVAATWPE